MLLDLLMPYGKERSKKLEWETCEIEFHERLHSAALNTKNVSKD